VLPKRAEGWSADVDVDGGRLMRHRGMAYLETGGKGGDGFRDWHVGLQAMGRMTGVTRTNRM
jgi:hypothetical protein